VKTSNIPNLPENSKKILGMTFFWRKISS